MWIITQNFIDFEEYGYHKVCKSNNCPIDIGNSIDIDIYEIKKCMPYKFRMLDDDENVYYIGYSDDLSFGPLNWAYENVGCTRIDYTKPDGEKVCCFEYDVWEQL